MHEQEPSDPRSLTNEAPKNAPPIAIAMGSNSGSGNAPPSSSLIIEGMRRSLSRASLASSARSLGLDLASIGGGGGGGDESQSLNELYRDLGVDGVDIGKNHGHGCPLIRGRESHTADLVELDRYVELLENMQRPDDSLPFNAKVWSYVRSILESARPVGFNEVDDPAACVPKGPDDANAFVQKVIGISEVNPIHPAVLATNGGFTEDEVVTELLYATKLGVVRMQWAPECDRCGSVVCARDGLGELPSRQNCEGCNYDNAIDSMDRIKVLFLLNPDILYVLADNFACTPSKESLAKTSVFAAVPATSTGSGFRYSVGVGAGCADDDGSGNDSKGELGPALDPGTYRMHCPVAKTDNYLFVERRASEADEPCKVHIKVSEVVYEHDDNVKDVKPGNRKTLKAPHGKIHFDITPDTKSFFVLWVQEDVDDDTLMALPQDERAKFTPATHVIHNDTFNHLFADQVVSSNPDALLSIQNIVLVFTDVVGSTDLYANLGDGPALQLVRKHFQILFGAFTKRGRVIKTIGDAVMASFTTGRAAMEAVADVFRILPKQCLLPSGEPLQIRVGIHCGSAVVVPLNGVNDYFGQTVNIAARVEAAAKASECFVTEDVLASDPDARSAYYEIVASSYVSRRSSNDSAGALGGDAGDNNNSSSGAQTDASSRRASTSSAASGSGSGTGKRIFVQTPETELHLKGVSGSVRARGFRLLVRPRRMSDVNIEPSRTVNRSGRYERLFLEAEDDSDNSNDEGDGGAAGGGGNGSNNASSPSTTRPKRNIAAKASGRRRSSYMGELSEEGEAALEKQFALPDSELEELEKASLKEKK